MSYGLLSTNVTRPDESMNSRRKIYWQYPSGAAQLMGILSLLPDGDATDKAVFGWFERRFPTQRTNTVATGTAPFLNGDGTALTDGGTGVTLTVDTAYQVKVLSTDQFKPTHVIEIRDAALQAGVIKTITGVVISVVSATVLKFRPNATVTGVANTTSSNNGASVSIKGTANRENARSGSGIYSTPINPTNQTQIFRSAFNVSRTALKAGLKYDKTGPWQNLAKENGLRHMIELEKAFLWGDQHTVQVADPETGEQTPETQTGGILWFLQQWEAANSIYRGGSGAAAITSNTDDNKRIVAVPGGTLTKKFYDNFLQNLFRVTMDTGYTKLALCGSKFLATLNELFDKNTVRQVKLDEPTTKASFIVYEHETLSGVVRYKTHPLFTEDPYLSGNALFLDLGNLRYRPLSDSDTRFLKGRQENDRDGRKDEWITEAGLEMAYPESCGYLTGVANAG